ncbi:membrane-associated tyrosine- and threonine-specific cdc2-inhibitory kinase-like [Diabrotica virgifera virgifera]|uniref:non-specific serine/threonine protein kinase n=1 Tax=Diabrotica virgifera virgifera TaxID=50390 RepID=A0ABM5L904_DIAVI|nr:membrane-associated tyrosine- and threonine-specific cdc2-inhibitory kinase-like [Diabrotica virgifera virgifera]
MGDNKENVPTTSNTVEDPLWDALSYQMESVGLQKPTKAKPAYVNIPVTLDPNYDESKDETYLDQIFSSLVMLGEGGFGQVFKGTHNFDNRKYAIKKIKAREDAAKYAEIKHFEKVGCHPHIVKYMMAWEEEHVYILMQLSQMSLANYINLTRNVSELVYFDCIHDICVALKYLADKGIIHLDVKDDNILIHGKVFKLSDFGNILDMNEICLNVIQGNTGLFPRGWSFLEN